MVFDIVIKVRKAKEKEIEDKECSCFECREKVIYRWSGGYFFCQKHHDEEMEDLITSESESESESDDEETQEK